MNDYKYLDNLITTNHQAIAITIAPMKILLGIQSADVSFDPLLTELLKYGIEKVEKRSEVFLSKRDVEIPFESWSGGLQLIGGGVMTGLSVKDLSNTDIEFTKISPFKITLESEKPFVIKYNAGLDTIKEDLRQAVLDIVDIKFNVKEIDEQEMKIKHVLKSLRSYVNASRWL